MRRLALSLLAVLATGAVAAEVDPIGAGERARVAQLRAELRAALAPEALESEEGVVPVPYDVWLREIELILGDHAGRRPYRHSRLGERWADLEREQAARGDDPALRAAWESLYWEWRTLLER